MIPSSHEPLISVSQFWDAHIRHVPRCPVDIKKCVRRENPSCELLALGLFCPVPLVNIYIHLHQCLAYLCCLNKAQTLSRPLYFTARAPPSQAVEPPCLVTSPQGLTMQKPQSLNQDHIGRCYGCQDDGTILGRRKMHASSCKLWTLADTSELG